MFGYWKSELVYISMWLVVIAYANQLTNEVSQGVIAPLGDDGVDVASLNQENDSDTPLQRRGAYG